jgi:hypothetical protein
VPVWSILRTREISWEGDPMKHVEARWLGVFTVGVASCALAPMAMAQQVVHIKKLTAPDAAASDQFGRSVALDNNECFIGAPDRAEGGVFASGVGYLFAGNLGGVDNWGFVDKRKEFIGGSSDRFGYSVGMAGGHCVAGVEGDDDNGTSSGGAYLYERDLGGIGAWGLKKKLLPSDGAVLDNFGGSADMDDGYVIIGARSKDSGQGAVYIFQQNFGGAGNWGESKKLVAPAPEDGAQFGNAVAVDNGVAVVGAFLEDALGSNSGAAYVFEELPAGAPESPGDRSGTWKFVKQLAPPLGGEQDRFGTGVDVDNGSVIVGSPIFQDGSGLFGAAFIFHRNQGGAGNYGFVKRLDNPDQDPVGSDFGRSVRIDGDIAIVGVSLDETPGGISGGAVYVYVRDLGGPDNWGFLTKVVAPDTAEQDLLGYDVDLEDGTILAGAFGDDDAGVASGSAHVFRINSICPSDLNGDGVVDTADLGVLIGSFGESGPGDINGDGVIDTADLGILIGDFSEADCAFVP